MNRATLLFAAAVALLSHPVRATDDFSVTNAWDGTFDLDARANSFAITNAAGFAEMLPLTFGTNDAGTVTVRNPNTGASDSYTKAEWEAALGGGAWAPGQGGAWKFALEGAQGGEATFTVRYMMYRDPATRHAGTEADPEVLYYGGELAEYGRDGFVFTMSDGVDVAKLALPELPGGCGVLDMGGGLYRLVEGVGYTYKCLAAEFVADARQDSTNRVVRSADELPPVAYSDDGWACTNSTGAVSLSFTPPGGAENVVGLAGTGGYGLSLGENVGRWLVTMTAGGKSKSATILYVPYTTTGVSASYNNLTNVVIDVSSAMPEKESRVSVRTVDGTEVAWATVSGTPGVLDPLCGSVTPQLVYGDLTPGVMYLATVDGEEAGEFANGVGMVTNFHAEATGADSEDKWGGDWAPGLAPAATTGEGYAISGTSRFDITAERPEGRYYCVDAAVRYSGFASEEDLDFFSGDDAVAGIVAVSNGTVKQWRALASPSGWVPLAGKGTAMVPELDADYTVRAEFDFSLSPRRVRYSVRRGGDFVVLTNGSGSAWLETAGSSNRLSAVSFTGSSGTVAMFEGRFADTNAVLDSSSNELLGLPTTGGGEYSLRTNLEGWKPESGNYAITLGGHSLGIPTTDCDGVAVYRDGGTVFVTNGYFEATNATRNARYTWLTNAVAKASAGAVVVAMTNVSPSAAWQACHAVLLNLDGHVLGGAGEIAAAEGATLTISNGYLAVSSVGPNVKVASGQATETAKGRLDGRLVPGRQFVQLMTNETHHGVVDFKYRVMTLAGADGDLRAVKVPAVGWVAVTNGWSLGNGGSPYDATQLNENGANGLPRWQSYVLGLDPSKAGDKPYLVPVQTASAGELELAFGPKCPANSSTTVRYVAAKVDSPTAAPEGVPDLALTANAASNITTSAVQYYKPKIELEPDPLISGEE